MIRESFGAPGSSVIILIMEIVMEDRETLEAEALKEVCACMYYDLLDGIGETSDAELQAIIEHKVACDCSE